MKAYNILRSQLLKSCDILSYHTVKRGGGVVWVGVLYL